MENRNKVENFERWNAVLEYFGNHNEEVATSKQIWFLEKLITEKTGFSKAKLKNKTGYITLKFEDLNKENENNYYDYAFHMNSKGQISGWKWKKVYSKLIETLVKNEGNLVID